MASFDRARGLRVARNCAIGLVLLIAVVGIVGFFVAPGIVKSVAERQITEQTGRRTTIGALEINPYRLSAVVRDFKLYAPDGTTPAAQIDEILANVSSASLFKRALVFDQLRVTHPQLSIVRLGPQRFDFSDIVDKLLAKPKTDDAPVRFSLNNIEVVDGSIAVDDRVTGRKHVVDQLRIGLPFVSNLPYDADLFVTPAFSARINGSTLALDGKAQLFSSSREASIEVVVSAFDLPTYADFVPTPLRAKLASGKLDTRLTVHFKAAGQDANGKDTPQSLAVAGTLSLTDLKITDGTAHEALALERVDVDAQNVEPLTGVVALNSVAIVAPQVNAIRRKDDSIDLVELFRPTPTPAPAPSPSTIAATTPPVVTIASVTVDRGTFRFTDETLAPSATSTFDRIALKLGAVALQGATPTSYALTLAIPGEGTLETRGTVVVAQKTIDGTLSVRQFHPGALSNYLATFVAARIGDGAVDVDTRYVIDAAGPAIAGRIEQLDARIDKLRTQLPNEKASFVAADAIVLKGGSYDFRKHAFAADALTVTAPVVAIARDAKGRFNIDAALIDKKAVVAPSPVAPASTEKQATVVIKPADAQPFTATIKALTIERGDFAFDDLSQAAPVHVRAAPLNFTAANVGTAADAVVPFTLDTVIDQRGKLAAQGRFTLAPMTAEATVNASSVAVGWLGAYAGNRLNIVIEDADLDARGTVRVATTKADALTASYRGSLGIVRMRALDRLTSQEFIRWKELAIPKVEFDLPAPGIGNVASRAPFVLDLGPVSLDDFYTRLIVNANGRLNVQDVVTPQGEQRSVTTPEAAGVQAAAPVVVEKNAKGKVKAEAAVSAPSGPMPDIRVAGVRLTKGRIGFTDNFIKPNYSANLTDLSGNVSAIRSGETKPSNLKVVGKIDGDGALDVTGGLNPFAPLLHTDVSAEAKDIELTRLTPYAIKYAGYAIERGKLSMTVKYHIENGKLNANNRLFLDQLTFGEHDPSSSANLPVRLAVALLKNSRGEIDINLPVSGTLTDPEFSIGGVIFRALLNLIGRAVTSPFALIGAAFGGSGEASSLGYVEFEPGVSEMTAEGKKRVEALAKALADRPALKLDIIGRYDPATDGEGVRRDKLLDRLKDLKAKDLSKPGSRVERNDVTIEPSERAALLARVYDDTKLPDKPRNAIGIAKSIPADEMERLLLASIKLEDNDPRWLADARADVVRHYLEDTGKVSPSRVFLTTAKLDAAGVTEGKPNRVDFALR